MKWSFKLGRFAGIDVNVHATFFLLLAWFGYFYWSATGTVAGTLNGIALILLLFLCVLLHEYGHALAARRFGIRTKDITLLPIGGVAMLEKMPDDPKQEVIVALAGPAVNVAIAAFLFLLIALGGQEGSLLQFDVDRGSLLPTLLTTNIILAIFNLLPAFPMDGGRVLRAVLAMRMDRVRATRHAATVGRALALLFGFLGLTGNPLLILIAIFVWVGAGAEADATEVDARLSQKPVGLAMITDFHTLHPGDPLARAVDLTLSGTQKHFPVVENGELRGVASQSAILRGLRDFGVEGQVGEIMGSAHTAEVGTSLDVLLRDLQETDVRIVCITRAGKLAGLVDLENISEYLRIQEALGRG
ncbi:site-2 protease family protein [Amaricoccus macauensis]|uniref:site-2 protease family protein n=1 Tax=Amaricoccus macauensis TaxID=57001 RepID=UPI003C7E285D